MTVITTSHVYLDEGGIPRIEGTRVKVAMIVMDRMNGFTPEQILEQRPHLSMGQIYGALAYYFDHQAEIDKGIAEQLKRVDAMREEAIKAGTQPNRQELEKRLKDRFLQS